MYQWNLIAIVFYICLSLPSIAIAKEYKTSGTGMSLPSAAADADGNTEPGFVGHEAGTGSFGKFTQTTVGDTVFTGFCSDNEVELSYVALSSILRSASGDLLYRRLISGTDSRVCFNFVSETARFTAHLEIVGGTGRFEGATGTAIQEGTVAPIGTQSGVQFTETGELVLSRRWKKDHGD